MVWKLFRLLAWEIESRIFINMKIAESLQKCHLKIAESRIFANLKIAESRKSSIKTIANSLLFSNFASITLN